MTCWLGSIRSYSRFWLIIDPKFTLGIFCLEWFFTWVGMGAATKGMWS
jgi:hypothetical protein